MFLLVRLDRLRCQLAFSTNMCSNVVPSFILCSYVSLAKVCIEMYCTELYEICLVRAKDKLKIMRDAAAGSDTDSLSSFTGQSIIKQ